MMAYLIIYLVGIVLFSGLFYAMVKNWVGKGGTNANGNLADSTPGGMLLRSGMLTLIWFIVIPVWAMYRLVGE